MLLLAVKDALSFKWIVLKSCFVGILLSVLAQGLIRLHLQLHGI